MRTDIFLLRALKVFQVLFSASLYAQSNLKFLSRFCQNSYTHVHAANMRVSLLLLLSNICTLVWAAGYQGCLERVWLFQAYDIDELNPESDRQIGFECLSWNTNTRTCNGGDAGYRACHGTRPGNRCTFNELMRFLGHLPNGNSNWAANGPDGQVYTNLLALSANKSLV